MVNGVGVCTITRKVTATLTRSTSTRRYPPAWSAIARRRTGDPNEFPVCRRRVLKCFPWCSRPTFLPSSISVHVRPTPARASAQLGTKRLHPPSTTRFPTSRSAAREASATDFSLSFMRSPHAPQDTRYLDVTGIVVGRAQAQNGESLI
jgi:hypothetical protein